MTDTTTSSPATADAALPVHAPAAERPAKPADNPVMRFFSSFALTVAILLCLMMLVYWGTRMQEVHGLNRAVHELFDAWICTINLHELDRSFTWPFTSIPLAFRWPGAYLLLSLLAVNIICGGIVRLKHGTRTFGVLVTHLSVLWLLLAGLVQAVSGTRGNMTLMPDKKPVGTYTSFDEWELVIGRPDGDGTVREYLVPDHVLAGEGVVRHVDLPFAVRIERYLGNCEPRRARNPNARDSIGGFELREVAFDKDRRTIPGAIVEVLANGQSLDRSFLWGLQEGAWAVEVGGVRYGIDLRMRVFDLPFRLRLEQFRHERHPGIDSPRHFSSRVVKVDDGPEQEFFIQMNHPMRYQGYMLSQNSWGPQQEGHPGPFFSVLEVSTNPADRWQMWACITIGLGMLWHFGLKLYKFAKSQMRKLAALREAAA